MNPASCLFGSRFACAQTAIFSAERTPKMRESQQLFFGLRLVSEEFQHPAIQTKIVQSFGRFFHHLKGRQPIGKRGIIYKPWSEQAGGWIHFWLIDSFIFFLGGGWALEFESFLCLWNCIEPTGEWHLGPKKLKNSRAQPPPTSPSNGYACIQTLCTGLYKSWVHRWFYAQEAHKGGLRAHTVGGGGAGE